MPEGDTVLRTAQRLHDALSQLPLRRVEFRWGRINPPPLEGLRTIEVVSRGKHLLHRVESGVTIHSHLRMEGQWRLLDTRELSPAQLRRHDLRALLSTDRWSALGLRLGTLEVLPTDQEDRIVGHLGPDLLGPSWNQTEALHRLASAPRRTVAEALLDQRNLAGIGTFYTAEGLFLERIHPWAAVSDLDHARLAAVLTRIRRLMQMNTQHPIQSTTGSRRRGENAYVHARSGLPCRRCRQQVRVSPLGIPPRERVLFYCPGCQGGVAATDNGRQQAPLGYRR